MDKVSHSTVNGQHFSCLGKLHPVLVELLRELRARLISRFFQQLSLLLLARAHVARNGQRRAAVPLAQTLVHLRNFALRRLNVGQNAVKDILGLWERVEKNSK